MNVIWKSHLRSMLGSMLRCSIEMPEGAKILTVGAQEGSATIWFLCDPEAPLEKRTFHIVGTGHGGVKDGWGFHGTCFIGPFVWHVFEEPP